MSALTNSQVARLTSRLGSWEFAESLEVQGMLKETADSCLQVLNFNANVFGLKAIRRAAYRFGSQFFVLITQHGRETEVQLIPKECCKSSGTFVNQFCNEVLDQELRERVAAEIAGVRDVVLALAYSRTSRVDCALAIRMHPMIQ